MSEHKKKKIILDCIKTIYSVNHKNGAIRRVNVNIAATTVENYKKLKEAGIVYSFFISSSFFLASSRVKNNVLPISDKLT